MSKEELVLSLNQYNDQLALVNEALGAAADGAEKESLLSLQSDLHQLVDLTQESISSLLAKTNEDNQPESGIDDEYALFMKEMAETGAYESQDQPECSKGDKTDEDGDEDIEDELASLLGMKCAVYHTHSWGARGLHNAMVSGVVPREDGQQFVDLQVLVLYTHPTHAEMLPCPFYFDGECKFSDEQCRYSHGTKVPLSNLKEAIEPDFESIRVGSRILLKLKPPDDQDISMTKKSTEKYHLWHRAVVKSVDSDNRACVAKLEQGGGKTGEKRKYDADELFVKFEEIFPLNGEDSDSSDSDSLSETEYPESKTPRESEQHGRALLIEKALQNNAAPMGQWEQHTRVYRRPLNKDFTKLPRDLILKEFTAWNSLPAYALSSTYDDPNAMTAEGMGSKLMLAMGYVPGTGLGAASDGITAPVEARLLPTGKSLDHCMAISEKAAGQDPLKVEQRLKRLQKKEEERIKKAYEREKEKEKRNVFNFLNQTLGSKPDQVESTKTLDVKQSTSKDLNIEQFKTAEDITKVEKEITKLKGSLSRHQSGTSGHTNINLQINERNKELNVLKNKEQQISKEQKHRKDKQKLTVF